MIRHFIDGTYIEYVPVSLDTLQPVAGLHSQAKIDQLIPAKEKKMFDDDECSNFEAKVYKDTRDWCLSELEDIADTHQNKAAKAFNIPNDDPPATLGELLKRLADGKFVIKDANANDPAYFNLWNLPYFITFRDPNRVANRTAYEASCEAIEVEKRKVIRSLMCSGTYFSSFDSLLNRFEKKDFISEFMPKVETPPANDSSPSVQQVIAQVKEAIDLAA